MASSNQKASQQPLYGAAVPLAKPIKLDRETVQNALRTLVAQAGARVRMVDDGTAKRGILSGLRSKPAEFQCEIAGVRLTIRAESRPLCSASVMHSFINPAIWRGSLTGMTGHRAHLLIAEAEGYALGGLAEFSLPIFRSIVELDPLNRAASFWLVLGQAFTGQFEVAVQAAEDFLNRFGDDGQVHTFAGVSLYALGRTDEAHAHFQKATAGRTDLASMTSLISRGQLLQEAGRREEALSTWQAGLETIRSRQELVANNSRLSVLAATLETLLYGASSQQSLLEELDLSGLGDFNLSLLAAAIAKQGDWQQAIEILLWSLDREFIHMNWKSAFWGLGVDPDAPELAEFRQPIEAKRLELAERFGPSDPFQEIPARQ